MFGLFIFCLGVAAIEFMLVIDLKPKAEIPLYVVALLMLFIPGLNIIEIVIFGILLTMACHNGFDLAGSNPVSKFFKMLNRNI
jgi:hypothetical protein